jgi:DNA-binding MarR family transcriptional regulator
MSISLTVVVGLVATLTRSLHSGRAHLARSRGLEPGSNQVLRHLLEHGQMRSSELTARSCVDAGLVSRQIKSLVESGLVERIPDPVDGRASLVRATDAGEVLFKQNEDIQVEFFERVFADWEKEDQAQFEKLLTKFVQDLTREVQTISQSQEGLEKNV